MAVLDAKDGATTRPSSSQLSACHKALGTFDILWHLFHDQHDRGKDYVMFSLSPRDLARCARVCRAFHEPALRVLWGTLDSTAPLWALLSHSSFPFSRPQKEQLHEASPSGENLWHMLTYFNDYRLLTHNCGTIPHAGLVSSPIPTASCA